jgi:hypothetical protein
MRKMGIDAACVVIADDANLELAREFGFGTIQRANDFLGARWNDGYQFAGEEGVDFIVPIGSDSWVHPSYFKDLPEPKGNTILTSRYYALVNEQGSRLARLEIRGSDGVGPHVVPTKLIQGSGYRPVREDI